jgi:Zn-dependent M16 (insulinase) family peptidase
MNVIHGFEQLREALVPEINSKAILYRHVKTGAQLLSLINDDENKVFGIAFVTPPSDSTGLPHILEHSVLCGSRKYPVKEPFIELAKGSLNTFLNAMTYPDRTIYPVASQNVKDLYNLIDVYLDAVFYPRITRWTLMQEGWHYELEAPDQPLRYKGVVFNEMKGAYSSPDQVLGRTIQHTLFPDTVYGFDSGGDPEAIPNLTYEQFKQFHETYYHPSNARIVFYGNDDPEERLRYLDSWLSAFDRREIHVNIPLQPRWDAPRRIIESYDASEEEKPRGMVSINWLLTDEDDPELNLALHILAHILVGTPASPLRKALIDSGLGENLTSSGFDDELRQSIFSVGLKGMNPDDADKLEQLVFDTLRELAERGIDPDQVEASVNTLEFRLRENNFGSFPRGIVFMTEALRTWIYGGDPIAALSFEQPLTAIKARLANNEPLFSNLIRRYLIDNPHRTTVILKPDPHLRERLEEKERARLDQARARMSQDDLLRIAEETKTLEAMQLAPDPPEALATIPTLKLEDLDKQNKPIPIEVQALAGGDATLLYHDLFTSGVVYLDLAFDMRAIPPEDVPYVALMGRALLQMGTEKEDFVRLLQRIGRKTGGISASPFSTLTREQRDLVRRFFLRAKSTTAQFEDLLDILRDVLGTARLDNRERFRQIVLENKASLESSLVPGGHAFVNTRLRAAFSPSEWAAEQMSGISQLYFLRALAERVERDWPSVLERLVAIRDRLVSRQGLVVNVTVDAARWAQLQPKLEAFVCELPVRSTMPADWPTGATNGHEGLAIPAQVNYVGKGADVYALGHQLSGAWLPVQNYLRTSYLWERVRMQGGAYGSFCGLDLRTGAFTFVSYRDPNLLDTLQVYDDAAAFLRQHPPSQDEVTRTIIGVIGEMDDYMLPDAKGFVSMVRYLAGDTDEARQKLRDEVLSTTPQDFVRFAEVLDDVRVRGRVVVMGAPEALAQANATLGDGWLRVEKVM